MNTPRHPADATNGSSTDEKTLGSTDLRYRVELWNGTQFEGVLALAANASLGRAIYAAAVEEYPERIVMLWNGDELIKRSAD